MISKMIFNLQTNIAIGLLEANPVMESLFSLMTDEGVENTETHDIICW